MVDSPPSIFDIVESLSRELVKANRHYFDSITLDMSFHRKELSYEIIEEILNRLNIAYSNMDGKALNDAQNHLFRGWFNE
jgi:hypothetical protein